MEESANQGLPNPIIIITVCVLALAQKDGTIIHTQSLAAWNA